MSNEENETPKKKSGSRPVDDLVDSADDNSMIKRKRVEEGPAMNLDSNSDAIDLIAKFLTNEDDRAKAETALKEAGVKTVQDFVKSDNDEQLLSCLFDIVGGVNFSELVVRADKIAKIKRTIEECLRDQKREDISGMARSFFTHFNEITYKPNAVVVQYTHEARDDNTISLVLGSSGTGKSVFAYYGLAERIFPKESTFTCFYGAKTVLVPDVGTAMTNLQQNVRRSIRKVAQRNNLTFPDSATLGKGVRLVVVLDEAGLKSCRELLGDEGKLSQLVGSLGYVADKFHLVLAGTGLEELTQQVDSNRACRKFRMRPWSMAQFKHLEWTYNQGADAGKVVSLVKSNPVLVRLVTNARCAFFVGKTVDRFIRLTSHRKPVLSSLDVSNIVAEVGRNYCFVNGLKEVTSDRKAQDVVYAVLAVLREAYETKNAPQFPDYGKHLPPMGKDLMSIVRSLVDVGVESHEGTVRFVKGAEFAASVTPAISIVLATLLGETNALAFNWSKFETLAAVAELQRCILGGGVGGRVLELAYSPEIFPGGGKKILVPDVSTHAVVVNAPKAEYGDVVSFKRIVQAKHTDKPNGTTTLYLLKELQKMGVTNSPQMLAQRQLTVALMSQWSENEGKEANMHDEGNLAEATEHHDRAEDGGSPVADYRNCHYPASLMAVSSAVDKPCTLGDVTKTNDVIWPETARVTVVFVTNAAAFNVPAFANPSVKDWKARAVMLGLDEARWKEQKNEVAKSRNHNEGNEAIKKAEEKLEEKIRTEVEKEVGVSQPLQIGRTDVDFEGKLVQALPAYITNRLLKGVECRFIFY